MSVPGRSELDLDVFFMRARTYLLLLWCCCCWLGKGDYANRIQTEHYFRKQSIGEANTGFKSEYEVIVSLPVPCDGTIAEKDWVMTKRSEPNAGANHLLVRSSQNWMGKNHVLGHAQIMVRHVPCWWPERKMRTEPVERTGLTRGKCCHAWQRWRLLASVNHSQSIHVFTRMVDGETAMTKAVFSPNFYRPPFLYRDILLLNNTHNTINFIPAKPSTDIISLIHDGSRRNTTSNLPSWLLPVDSKIRTNFASHKK